MMHRIGEVLNERFRVDAVLGKGAYGCVVKATDLVERDSVAIKIVKGDALFFEQAQREIKILQYLMSRRHPNIGAL